MNTANYNTAVEQLKKVKSVSEWNEVRANLSWNITDKELARIDSGGLIVEVLGADTIQQY